MLQEQVNQHRARRDDWPAWATALALLLTWIATFLLACALTGCKHRPTREYESATIANLNAGAAVSTVGAHVDAVSTAYKGLGVYVIQTGAAYYHAVAQLIDKTAEKAKEAEAQHAKVQRRIDDLEHARADWQAKHDELRGRWYIRAVLWVRNVIVVAMIAWGVLGIGAIVLGLGNPLGWAVTISKEIVRLVPLMNPFAWVRDGIVKRKATKKAAA